MDLIENKPTLLLRFNGCSSAASGSNGLRSTHEQRNYENLLSTSIDFFFVAVAVLSSSYIIYIYTKIYMYVRMYIFHTIIYLLTLCDSGLLRLLAQNCDGIPIVCHTLKKREDRKYMKMRGKA